MTKQELMENYTMEQLADKIIALEILLNDNKNTAEILKREHKNIISEKQSEIDCLKEEFQRKETTINQIDDILNELFGVTHDVAKPDEFKEILKETIEREREDAKRLENEYAEALKKAAERQEKIECLEKRTIADFLPTEPVCIAGMLMNLQIECENNPLSKMVTKEETYMRRMFDVSELRQIAEHLLVYCNANESEE